MKQEESLQNFNLCQYVDLDSQNAYETLSECSNNVINQLNKYIKNDNKLIEGFVNFEDNIQFFNNGTCCPDGTTFENGECNRLCINCKYNDCDNSSSNIGVRYNYDKTINKNAILNQNIDDEMVAYIFGDVMEN